MSQVTVRKVENGHGAVVNPVFMKLENTLEAVRKRAFELFEARGGAPGNDVADWVQAEKDLFFVPPTEMEESDKGLQLKLSMDGFAGDDIEVIARQGEILVWAKNEKHADGESVSKSLYRHVEIPEDIDSGKVKAHLQGGILTIEAVKKAPDKVRPVLVRSHAA